MLRLSEMRAGLQLHQTGPRPADWRTPRALCLFLRGYRGTPEKPGLVLGLDRGGACRGVAFRVAEKHSAATVAYLREREQVTSVYREVKRSVWLENEARLARHGAG